MTSGVNPVNREELSDTERVMMAGTLFVPSFLSGSAKVVKRLAKAAKAVIRKNKNTTKLADELVTAINKSDDDLAKYLSTPCGGGGSGHLRMMMMTVGSPSGGSPCELGAVTDSVVDELGFVPGNKFKPVEDLSGSIHEGIQKNIIRNVDTKQFNKLLESRDPEAVDAFMANFKEINGIKNNKNVALFELDYGGDAVTFAIQNGQRNQLPAAERLLTDGMTINEKGMAQFIDPDNGWNRANDSERLALEAIAKVLTDQSGPNNKIPMLNLISERQICDVCNDALTNFKSLMDQHNIKVDIGSPLTGTTPAYRDK